MQQPLAVGLIQMASSPDWNENVQAVRGHLKALAGRCDLLVFPENVLCLGHGDTVKAQGREFAELYDLLGGLCREYALAAVFGGVPVATQDTDHVLNSSLAFDHEGGLLARYDKMHLFQLNPGQKGGVDETSCYVPGPHPASFDFQGWTVGLSICYDVRFPELFRIYAGVDVILCTAAFTHATGKAHWDVLLRARAIENLCYVIGVGQCGVNQETGVRQYGHSLVVEPWGQCEATMDDTTPGTRIVTLNRDRISEARQALPALDHRRFDITPRD